MDDAAYKWDSGLYNIVVDWQQQRQQGLVHISAEKLDILDARVDFHFVSLFNLVTFTSQVAFRRGAYSQ